IGSMTNSGEFICENKGRFSGELQESGAFKADIGNKKSNTAADGVLERARDGFYYHLSYLGNSDNNIDNTADKDHCQSLLPGETKAHAYRKGKECIKTHPWSLSIGYVSNESHDQSSYSS